MQVPAHKNAEQQRAANTLMQEAEVRVAYRGRQAAIQLPESAATVRQLSEAIEREFQVAPSAQKLLVGGKVLWPVESPGLSFRDVGIRVGDKILVLSQPGKDELAKLNVPDQRIRGFDEELRNAATRRQRRASSSPPSGQYTFQGYEAWNVPTLHPPPAVALKLLHSLAADRGIVAIMTQNRWSVGKLSEMPPEGKVGVSPVCILGVNINSGQEISLRLRTDDLCGFRRYERIRETLVHELVHMVFSEHDNNFKELNSQLLREAAAQDWTRSARALAGEAASFHADWESSPANADAASMPASRRLGGALPVTTDAQAAAAQAALDRAHAHAASAPPVPELQAVGLSEPPGDQGDSIEGLGHCDGSTEKLEDEMRRLGTPTAEDGSRSSPFTQDHCHGSAAPYSDGLKGSGSMESTQPNAAQDSSANAADDLASPVEQAVHGIVSAGTPSSAKAALDSVMKIIQHIVDEPGEAKFRRLRERALERRTGKLLPHCVKLLEASGFEKLAIDGETVLLLLDDSTASLQSVLQMVQRQHDSLSS